MIRRRLSGVGSHGSERVAESGCGEVLIDRAGRLLTRGLRTWMIKTSLKVGTPTEVGPFVVYGEYDVSPNVIGSIRTALQLIERLDPRRYKRLSVDVPILLLVQTGGGFIHSDVRTASLEYRTIYELSIPELAGYLIALGARARIARAPFAPKLLPHHQRRIWRRATLEQVAFFSRLPEREFSGVEDRIRSLRQSIPEEL